MNFRWFQPPSFIHHSVYVCTHIYMCMWGGGRERGGGRGKVKGGGKGGERDINAVFSSHHSLITAGEMAFRSIDFTLIDESGCPGRCCYPWSSLYIYQPYSQNLCVFILHSIISCFSVILIKEYLSTKCMLLDICNIL